MAKIHHHEMVSALAKPGSEIQKQLTAEDCFRLHMLTLLAAEAGELLDAFKKNIFYRKEIDVTNVIEEMGDIEFALEALRQSMQISREEVLDGNIDKLAKRYENFVYSDLKAKERADKNEPVA